ncbi:MAG: S8 family serine peptidase [Nitrospirota bacterium]
MPNKNFTTSRTVDDLYGHGTHVAGIAGALTNNGIGVAGLGFLASLMNGKVLGDTGLGYYSWVASGIIWATNGPDGIAGTPDDAKVINMSLGGTSYSLALEDAVNYAWGKGVVMTAAAGNSDTDLPFYPAYYINVIAVAATDENDNRAGFSNFGGWVDVSAPGVNIYSTMPNHRNRLRILNYGYLSGTSMSSPHVAGLAALVWKTQYGTDNSSVVRGRIEATVDTIITDEYIGKGRINAARAVGAIP